MVIKLLDLALKCLKERLIHIKENNEKSGCDYGQYCWCSSSVKLQVLALLHRLSRVCMGWAAPTPQAWLWGSWRARSPSAHLSTPPGSTRGFLVCRAALGHGPVRLHGRRPRGFLSLWSRRLRSPTRGEEEYKSAILRGLIGCSTWWPPEGLLYTQFTSTYTYLLSLAVFPI